MGRTAISWNAHRELRLFKKRGGPRRRTRRPSRRKLDLTDHLLATVLHHRLGLPQTVIASLFGADKTTISHAISLTRTLLTEHGTTIQPAHPPLRTPSDLRQYAAARGINLTPVIKTAC